MAISLLTMASTNITIQHDNHNTVDLESKYDEDDDKSIWRVVGLGGVKKATTAQTKKQPKTKKWVPIPTLGPDATTIEARASHAAYVKEAERVKYFRKSVAAIEPRYVFESRSAPSSPIGEPDSPISAPIPSSSRSKFDLNRIKAKKMSGIKRDPKRQASRAFANFVGKSSSEVLPKPHSRAFPSAAAIGPTPFELSNPFAPLGEPERGMGIVKRHDKPGTTHVHNNAGRLITVTSHYHRVTGVKFLGFFKKTLGTTFTPSSIGLHVSGEERLILLPDGLVESIGANLVGKIPNMETYLWAQNFCKNWCQDVDFDTPALLEDAMIYAPYLALINRGEEREGIMRKIQGKVWTRNAVRCVKAGAMASAVMSLPVAAATTAAGVGAVAAGLASFACATALTVGVSLIVRKGLSYFSPDELVSKHKLLSSSNSTAKTPQQHPDARIRRLPLFQKSPNAVNGEAARVTGLAVQGQEPTIFAKNQDNTIAALEKRSGILPPPFGVEDRQDFCDWVIKNWNLLVSKPFKIVVPGDPEAWATYALSWVDGCNSTPQAKEIYRRTIRELADSGVTPHSKLSREVLYAWTKREVSVKLETVLKDADKSPRQILAATPQFVVLTAPFIKDLTGAIRKAWRPGQGRTYAPGASSRKMAEIMTQVEWDNNANVDFDGYDSCQGVQIGRLEVKVCQLYGAPVTHLDLMRHNFETHGVSREGVKFNTPYVRNSGDPWTTVFNTMLNGCLMTFVYCRVRECGVRDVRARFHAGGDDGVLQYDGPRIDFGTELIKLGFPATIEHVDRLHHIEFLSCRLTETSTGWNFVRKCGQMIAKLGYSVRARTNKQAAQIARGAAMSLYAGSHGCPPLRLYLDTILRVTNGFVPIGPANEPWRMSDEDTGDPTSDTWFQLGDVYGYTYEMHSELEKTLASVKEPGVAIKSPILELLCERDSAHKSKTNDVKHAISAGWVRDLTVEGVEPNPGPTRRANRRGAASASRAIALQGRNRARNIAIRRTMVANLARRRAALGLSRQGAPRAFGIPAAMSTVSGTMYFRTSSTAQRNVSQDAGNSIRAHGCALFSQAISINPSTASTINGGLANDTTVMDLGYALLAPSTIDTRLTALASTYQYYALRRMRFTYSPSVATSTAGKLYLGVYKDPDAADSNFGNANPAASGFSGGTATNVMQCDPAMETAVWQTATKEFVHRGTQLWQTYPDGEEPTNERVQAAFVSVVRSASTSAALNFGDIFIEYEMDFYVPGPPLGSGSSAPQNLTQAAGAVTVATSTTPWFNVPYELADSASDYLFTGDIVSSTGGGTNLTLTVTNGTSTLTVPSWGGSSITGGTSLIIPHTYFTKGSAASIAFDLIATGASVTATFGQYLLSRLGKTVPINA